ncbi:MAG: hypothetical protein KDD53_03040 [Bdellovibrionales bacterium]|nr:hypothetical protein [Bdellovibrionales bacterium]
MSDRSLLKLLYQAIAILLLAFICAVFSLDLNSYAPTVASQISRQATKSGVILSFEVPSLSRMTFSAKSARAILERPFLPLTINNPKLVPSLWSTILTQPAATVTAEIAQGSLQSHLGYSLLSGTTEISGSIRDSEISKLPYLKELDATGKLSIEIPDLSFTSSGDLTGHLDLKLSGIKKPNETQFDLRKVNLIGKVPIPPLENLDLTLGSEVSSTRVRLVDLKLNSSWGTVVGSGEFSARSSTDIGSLNFRFEVRLTEQGYQYFGNYLGKKNFGVIVKGTPLRPVTEVVNLAS